MARFHKGNARLAAPHGALWIGLIGMALTTALGLGVVSLSSWTQSTFELDRWLNSFTSPVLFNTAAVLEELDSIPVVAIILLTGGLLLSFTRGWLPAIGFTMVAGLGWLLIAVIKEIVREPRPTPFYPEFVPHSYSFPSGHTVFAMTLTVAVWAVLAGSAWRWPLVIALSALTLLTAWSRLYIGVHYPMDVVGGIVGGISSALVVLGAWNFLFARKRTT